MTPDKGVVTSVEVKIGVQHAARELVLESAQTPQEVEEAVTKAIAAGAGTVLQLVDEKGRRVVVPSDKVAYVEVDEQSHRPLGFRTS